MNYRWPSTPTNDYNPWYVILPGLMVLPVMALGVLVSQTGYAVDVLGRVLCGVCVGLTRWSVEAGLQEFDSFEECDCD